MRVLLHHVSRASKKDSNFDVLVQHLRGRSLVLAKLVLPTWPSVARFILGPTKVRIERTMQDAGSPLPMDTSAKERTPLYCGGPMMSTEFIN